MNTTINAIKHSRSMTAAASIQSRFIFASFLDFCRSSSSTEIRVSSRSRILVNVWSLFALSSAVFWSISSRSRSLWRLSSESILLRPSIWGDCFIVLNESRGARRPQISCLAWKKQVVGLFINKETSAYFRLLQSLCQSVPAYRSTITSCSHRSITRFYVATCRRHIKL